MTIGLVSRPGVGQVAQVMSVVPGGPAATAGLEQGDEIVSVNGNRFPNMIGGDIAQVLSSFVGRGQPQQAYPVQVDANGKRLTVTRPGAGNPAAAMVVRNVRNGQNVQITVYPTRR